MKKDYVRFNTFYESNLDFKENTESLIEDYFCPEGLGIEGYLCVGDYNKKLATDFSTNSENQENLYDPLDNNISFPKKFSFYENLLTSHIFHGKMRTLVVSGAMGSGKSTTIDYIFETLKEHPLGEKNIIIKLDFNKGFSSKDIDELNDSFLEELYSKLHVEIIDNFSTLGLSDEFLKKVLKECQNYSKFYDFSFEKIYDANKEWDNSDEKKKIFLLLKFIKENAKRVEHRVEMLMKFLNFISETLSKTNNKVILFYDNLDKLPAVAQLNILNKIIAYNHIASITKIISIRRSTKAKLDRLIDREINSLVDNRGQTVYGHIYHHGPSPWRLYLKKVEKFIENFDDIKMFSHLSAEYKKALKERANEISESIAEYKSDLKQAIHCVAGESNRLGLTLTSRNFCNNIFPYNDKAFNKRSLVRSLYCGFNDKNIISGEDEYVANILSNNRSEFDVINYLIITIIIEENKEEKPKTNASYIYNFLLNHFEYSNNQIISALNYLLKDKRALIGGQYYPHYKDSDELYRVDDNLRITELGERYFNKLMKKGTIYTQTCLFSLKWEFGSDRINKDTIYNRLSFLIQMLNDSMEIEYKRNELYQLNIDEFNVKDYKITSTVCDITELLFNEFAGVINSMERNFYMVDKLEEWINKVASWNYFYYDIFGEQTESLLYHMKNTVANISYKKN